MIHNHRFHPEAASYNFDKADIVVLTRAILDCENAEGETIVSVNYGHVYDLAKFGSVALQKFAPYENEWWDGCVWLERLMSTDCDSLAYKLAELSPIEETSEERVSAVVKGWVVDYFGDFPENSTHFYLGHDHWCFDQDSIYCLDDELGWEFHCFHRLSEPTSQAVMLFMHAEGFTLDWAARIVAGLPKE